MKKIINQLKKPGVIKTIAIILIFISVVAITFLVLKKTGRVDIENSLVTSPIISLSSTVPGKLKSIEVIEGQKVKKGDALAVVGTEVVRAYTDGVIIDTNKQIGSIATAQVQVVKMVSSSEMRIDGTLDENKGLNKIKTGQIVSFTIDALPGQEFWGYVDTVGETAKQTQISFSISSERPTQQFDVYARFDSSTYPQIKNGMSAKMVVYTNVP